jgi:hypothetical protein
MKKLLTKLSLLHPLNRIDNNWEYPQLWYVWNKNRFYYRFIVFLCSILTEHELSKTECEYGGGNFRDGHCRWCDKLIKVPMDWSNIPGGLQNLAKQAHKNSLRVKKGD